ncbi:MAG: hypothetical protein AAGB31_01820 [Bdellovibrio sp.]
MNFLLPLFSFLLGNAKGLFKEPGIAFTQQLVLHLRSLTLVLVSTLGSLALSCVGLSLLISSIAGQLDKNEDFHFTGGMIVYTIMTLLAGGTLLASLRRKTWLKALGFDEKPTTANKQSGALENAVALLVMDYIEERQSRRQQNPPP